MKIQFRIFSVIFAAFGLFACEKVVDWELPEQGAPILVVEGGISNKKDIWRISLTKTRPYFESGEVPYVEHAQVSIIDDNGNTVALSHQDTGLYTSADSQQCVVGRNYTLNINLDGEDYSATERCGYQEPIDTVASFYLPPSNGFIPEGNYIYELAQESPAPGDHYRWNIYRNDTLVEGFGGYFLDTDELADFSYFNSNFDLQNLTPENLPRPFPVQFLPGDSARLEQWRISEGYYNFLNDLVTQSNRFGSPFDAPPANPRYNISNGAIGYFFVYNCESKSLVIP